MDPNDLVMEFMRKLVTQVQDVAISQADLLLEQDSRGVSQQRMRSLGIVDGPGPRALITEAVHTTIFTLLSALVEQRIRLTYHADSGETVDVGEVGLDWIQMIYASGDEGLRELAEEWDR